MAVAELLAPVSELPAVEAVGIRLCGAVFSSPGALPLEADLSLPAAWHVAAVLVGERSARVRA